MVVVDAVVYFDYFAFAPMVVSRADCVVGVRHGGVDDGRFGDSQ